ncbi:hypothetical protein P7G87_12625 [Enterococcus asini]|uniref:hypothetical protein n=1 Tax=Enterococcus asini TaxID=57732 RepID=UPI001E4B4AA3|nr:hypothetical protein [Enterococcus asini]MCD5030293.1 hypothetical protein [Enterococcus asini]MDT2745397.1 hypothetical protein [Enterococcus asini]MDT2785517.1 hypothetical protein [Enterococcus asini]
MSNELTRKFILFLLTKGIGVQVIAKSFRINANKILRWQQTCRITEPDFFSKSKLAFDVLPSLMEQRKALDRVIQEVSAELDR